MPVIIDGHNLLWAIQGMGDKYEAITDVRLCHIVGRYLKTIGEQGEIVFDGTGPPDKSRFDNIPNLEVFFAGLGTDADTVIESKIRANTAPKRLTVVSSDRRLISAAGTRRAPVVKAEAFWRTLQSRPGRATKIKEPPSKHIGLTESETEQWFKLFGLDQ